jgi:hypothetical protein
MMDSEIEARFAEMQDQLDQLYSWHGRQNLIRQQQAAKQAGTETVEVGPDGQLRRKVVVLP